MPKIDVCIASYKRPQLLHKLLESLFAQETAGEFSFGIIVTDNDAQRSAEPVVRALNARGRHVIYAVEPEQNISLARNRSLSLASGDYIATIDDDEYADSRWLLHLYRAMIAQEADVVHGPVIAQLPPGTPRYIGTGFMRPNPSTGSRDKYILNAGNTLFRREIVEGLPVPFDPAFGRTGGEDTAFFCGLRRRGYRMVWCREARVFEHVPRERANLAWLLKRKFRNGNLYPRCLGFTNQVRAAQFGNLCMDILVLCWRSALFMTRGIFNSGHRERGVQNLLEIPFHLGVLTHYLKFQVGNRGEEAGAQWN